MMRMMRPSLLGVRPRSLMLIAFSISPMAPWSKGWINDGKVIRINIPPLTEDRRKELCKIAAKYAEEGKVALRNNRRDGIDRIKKQEKEGELSEDQSRDEQEKVQKLTDRYIAELDKHLAEKEAEILKV